MSDCKHKFIDELFENGCSIALCEHCKMTEDEVALKARVEALEHHRERGLHWYGIVTEYFEGYGLPYDMVRRINTLKARVEESEAFIERDADYIRKIRSKKIKLKKQVEELKSKLKAEREIAQANADAFHDADRLVEELEGLTRPFRNGDVSVDTISNIVNYYKAKGETK